MTKPRSSRTKSNRVGPRIVRAWFDTVINPLLSYLEREQQLLSQKNWTWRFRPASLEAIREVRVYIDREAWPNLEQFEELHPNVRRAQTAHDKRVIALTRHCQQLHKALRTSEDLHNLFLELITPKALGEVGKDLRDLFGAYPKSDYLDVLAEHIINSTGDLPSHYTTAPFWNLHRHRFLAILDHPAVRAQWEAANRAGESLLRESRRLSQVLGQVRMSLSLEHDVPYVVRADQFIGGSY